MLAVFVCIIYKRLNFNESAVGNVYRVVYDAAVQLWR